MAYLFPPDITIRGHSTVSEDTVGLQAVHCIGVRRVGSAWGNSKEAVFWVQSIDLAIFTETHPSNIISKSFNLKARHIGLQHCQIGLSTGTWEGGSDVFLYFGFLVSDSHNKHVLSEPSLTFSHIGCNSQGKAFLSEKSISTISTSVTPNFIRVWELNNELVFNWCTWPFWVFLAWFQWEAH